MNISQNVLRALDAHGNAHQAIRDAELLPPRRRHLAMRGSGRVQHPSEYIAQAGGAHAKLERIHKLKGRFARVGIEFNGKQRTGKVLAQGAVNSFIFVGNESGIVNFRDIRMAS